jgi:hypothetical protein
LRIPHDRSIDIAANVVARSEEFDFLKGELSLVSCPFPLPKGDDEKPKCIILML